MIVYRNEWICKVPFNKPVSKWLRPHCHENQDQMQGLVHKFPTILQPNGILPLDCYIETMPRKVIHFHLFSAMSAKAGNRFSFQQGCQKICYRFFFSGDMAKKTTSFTVYSYVSIFTSSKIMNKNLQFRTTHKNERFLFYKPFT